MPITLVIRWNRILRPGDIGKEHNYRADRVHTFFSMVDGRKTMHREMTDLAMKQFDQVFENTIPYLAAVEQMGMYRQPLPAYAPRSRAEPGPGAVSGA